MRIWTLHPRHLDAVGLVALWRETLLAQGCPFRPFRSPIPIEADHSFRRNAIGRGVERRWVTGF
jgi:hypothetical protein